MRIKGMSIVLCLLLLFSPSLSQDTMSLSLQRCLEIGMESNQAVINAKFDKDIAGYQKQEALAKLLPQVEGFGAYDNYVKLPVVMIPGEIFGQPGTTIPASLYMQHNISGGFKATQLLYSKTAFTAMSLAKQGKEMSKINLDKVNSDFIYDLSNLYFLIKTTEKQMTIFRENLERLNRLQEITGAQYRTGLLKAVDLERVKVDRENLLTEYTNLEIFYSQQIEMLKYTIGLKKNIQINLTDSLQYKLLEKEFFPDSAHSSQRPELRLMEKQQQLALLNRKLAVSECYPTLALYGQYYYQGQRDQFDFFEPGKDKWFKVGVVGLSLNIPIFTGFERLSKINQAKASYSQAVTNLEFTRHYYTIEYENAVKKYRNNLVAETRQRDNTQLALQVYDQILLQYQQGVASLSDLLSAESSLSESNLSLFNTTLQLRVAELDILRAGGELKSILNK